MDKLRFCEITSKNIYEIAKLSDTLNENQKKCVANNSFSIAEGSVNPHNAFYRGVYHDDTPVGFFMLFIPNKDFVNEDFNDFYLWRLMISAENQKKGYGKLVLNEVIRIGKEKGFRKLLTSCEKGLESPYDFYINYGFKEDGKDYDGEIGLSIEIQ